MAARVIGLVIVAPLAFGFFYSLAVDVSRWTCSRAAGTDQAALSACYERPEPPADPGETTSDQLL